MFDAVSFPWDWVLVALTAVTILSLGKSARFWAVGVGLVTEVAWIWYAVATSQYGFISGAVFLGIPVGYNAYLWYQSKAWAQAWDKAKNTGEKSLETIRQYAAKPETAGADEQLAELFAMRGALQTEYPWSRELGEEEMLMFAGEALETVKTGLPAGNYNLFLAVVSKWEKRINNS